MRINRIEIDNFLAVGQATLDFDSKGLVLIQGQNKDDASQNSNGAGKSSLVDALQWAIYANTSRDQSGDSVINNVEKKNCRVLVQLVDNEQTYNIIRHRKHKEHKNKVLLLNVTNEDDVIDLTSGTDKLTQAKINQMIGCSEDVFKAAVYYGQEAQLCLPEQTDKTLKLIVEEAAGIDKMQDAHAVARTEMNAIKEKLESHKQLIDSHVDKIQMIESFLSDIAVKIIEFDQDKLDEIEQKKTNIKNIKAQIKSTQSQINDIDIEALEVEASIYQHEIDSVQEAHERDHELWSVVNRHKSALEQMQSKQKALKSQCENIKLHIDNAENEIGKQCDSCGQIIQADSLKDRISVLKRQLKEGVKNYKDHKLEIESQKNELVRASQLRDKHQASIIDISETSIRLKRVSQRINEYTLLVNEKKTQLKAIQTLVEQIERIKSKPNTYNDLKNKKQTELEKVINKLTNLEKKVKSISVELDESKAVVDIFSTSGIRAHILDTVTPFLNDRTAQYLAILSDGNIQATWSTLTRTAKGELREKFAVDVTSGTGGHSYKSLSGGEKRKVKLATALALQDLVSSRATKPIQLWIGDEIDDAVDESGLERLMTVLEDKAKQKGTVLIISHNELSDWCRQHVVICKHKGKATVEGVLNIDREKLGV